MPQGPGSRTATTAVANEETTLLGVARLLGPDNSLAVYIILVHMLQLRFNVSTFRGYGSLHSTSNSLNKPVIAYN